VPVQPYKSVIWTVKLWLVLLVGVPVMAPEDVFRVKPAGSVPLVTENV
jgi:hypothetical protein